MVVPVDQPPGLAAELGARPDEPGADAADLPLTVIESRSGWQAIELGELWRYRELLYFLAWRDVKVRYKQTLLGTAWAVLQPTLMMVVFTLVLGQVARVPTPDVPYPIFAFAGLLGWMFFATAVSHCGQSVVAAERLITKVYFPRLAVPLASVGPALVDLAMGGCVLAALMASYGMTPSWTMLLVPLAAALLLIAALGVGTLLAALNVAYRDVRYVLPFLIQLWLFATPAVYLDTVGGAADERAASALAWLSLNPLNGLVAFFRATVLGGPLPWNGLIYPVVAAVVLLIASFYCFRRVEDSFADII